MEVCLSKKDIGWDASECTALEYENDAGDIKVKCDCITLNPTTIVSDIDDLFSNS